MGQFIGKILNFVQRYVQVHSSKESWMHLKMYLTGLDAFGAKKVVNTVRFFIPWLNVPHPDSTYPIGGLNLPQAGAGWVTFGTLFILLIVGLPFTSAL